ncbi:iron-containing alcohol dehydrogenase family protein [Thermosynechococcaceae cyanobacterium BACA0444]|uniref:Iron-containing alcohol dehydrogenase family protein n=1 Tax=Pseudocalidococcus azoricus BACA0444 TaxID=2918990 RepID=A0AAE4FTC2_9CYAN|nr:iron-containing alcohol dehydrogenase family protein [Pseudocalidococcus azoricus]MDS3861172.1 iron-containing alcohol dehydrogenase family protein [Pseudocalidococcus azoricus BACA0444]
MKPLTTSELFLPLTIAPAQVQRGWGILAQAPELITAYGRKPLIIGGQQAQAALKPYFANLQNSDLIPAWGSPVQDCSEPTLGILATELAAHSGDVIIGVGGGKALDTAKLVAQRAKLPIVTIPTSGATCAAWTALSNVYNSAGAFQYDVALDHCPNLLLLDYQLIATAPQRTLIAGIGDALAKWYEASISSGHSQHTLIIAAVQQARVLRDLLLQKSSEALQEIGGPAWQEVVDATVLMAGMIGGLGGAQCRTVAAHAVHNGLTHLSLTKQSLHGEKVAYGILAQLRLEELIQGSHLAASSRQQLLSFYREIGLPTTLSDLGLGDISLRELETAATQACLPTSDIHHLPFTVTPAELMAAMISTTAETTAMARANSKEGLA